MPTEVQSLAKIFNNRIFRIPDYQRGYAWGERQLADFWSDLQRAGNERIHYCGQLTLEKAPDANWQKWEGDEWLIKDADYEPYFIVDGQQRITTSIILLQCLLEDLEPDSVLAGQKVSELREKYLAKGNGVLRSCLFGYANDNPSHEFFRTQILGVPSNEYNGTRTVYTTNLGTAKDYFKTQIAKLNGIEDKERLLKAMVQRFRFNLHELSDDIDVFMAFETMNNRGKSLSRLELLKNRLIYLSTLAKEPDAEKQKVRSNINAVWRTIYEELGRNPDQSLDDDDFLRAHWIVFFGYDKDEADPLTRFLLNWHFTLERLDAGKLTLAQIQTYVDSLQVCARVWQRLHFPEHHVQVLGKDAHAGLVRLKRLGFGVLRPLILAILSKSLPDADLAEPLKQAERFLLLVRSFAGTRSHVGEADSYRLANEIHGCTKGLHDCSVMLADRVSRHFTTPVFQTEIDDLFADENQSGFYSLPGLHFVLFEFEEHLRRAAKSPDAKIDWDDFKGARKSIEHVYPQQAEDDAWPAFQKLTPSERRLLLHNLGNLAAVSVAKNASLSRSSFESKKKGTDKIPGFSQGSFSELRIAQNAEWTSKEILERGIEMLEFIETRWLVNLGDREKKIDLLNLGFMKEDQA